MRCSYLTTNAQSAMIGRDMTAIFARTAERRCGEENRMGISEEKMKIVIENYFKAKCNINTTIHDAFEKGFRIGVQKGISSERKKGRWFFSETDSLTHCSNCGQSEWKGYCPTPKEATEWMPICPKCGADMRGEQDDSV